MKTLLTAFLLLPLITFSQITLTAADFADEGDTVRMSSTTDLGIDYSTTGSNQTWDYSTLIPDGQFRKDFLEMSTVSFLTNVAFGGFAQPSHQASYYLPNSDLPLSQLGGILPVNISNVFQFSKKSNDSITSVGYAIEVSGTEVPFKSDTVETRYKFPLDFGNAYYSRGYTNMDLNPILDAIWRQYRQRSSVVDGWGSITTPYGTFDALRIKHTITEVDSISYDILGTGTPMWISIPIPDSYIYEWWTNSEKEAVLRIETSDVLGNEVVSNIEYRDAYLGMTANLDELSSEVIVFPNPAENALHVKGLNESKEYSIVNSKGQIVQSGSVSTSLNIESLPIGNYQLLLDLPEGIVPISFIKK